MLESEAQAMAARDKVKVQYTDMKTPIVTIDQAIKAQSYHPDPEHNTLTKGDAKGMKHFIISRWLLSNKLLCKRR